MKVTYEGVRVAPFRVRAAVAWAVLWGRSVTYEVLARDGDTICRVVRRTRKGDGAGELPAADVMEWLHETYYEDGVEVWLKAWRGAGPTERARMELHARIDPMGG